MTVSLLSLILRLRWLLVGALLVSWLIPGISRAHKVTIFAWVEGDRIHTESKFSGGRRAKDAPIEVYDMAGNKLLEGRTDAEGRFGFEVPGSRTLRIVLKAGQGHQNEWIVEKEEILEATGTTAAGGLESNTETGAAVEAGRIPTNAPIDPEALANAPDAVEKRLEALLDRKLQPVLRRLRTLEESVSRPALRDIIGGIGYIFGLVGVAAYVQARKRKGGSGG